MEKEKEAETKAEEFEQKDIEYREAERTAKRKTVKKKHRKFTGVDDFLHLFLTQMPY